MNAHQAQVCVLAACRRAVIDARDAEDLGGLLLRLSCSDDTLRRMMDSDAHGGWSLARVLAIAAYEEQVLGRRAIRIAIAGDPAPVGEAVAARGELVGLIGRVGALLTVTSRALSDGRVTAAEASALHDELRDLVETAQAAVLPALRACAEQG
jgi:hypothetical protein